MKVALAAAMTRARRARSANKVISASAGTQTKPWKTFTLNARPRLAAAR